MQLLFNMPCNYTIHFKWRKQVGIKTTGYKKIRVTVMLCITAYGNKLPPYITLGIATGYGLDD
jgi:hypothetical protein